MNQPILYLMFGYPGAGKTTVAAIIAEYTKAVHLSSDAIRLELFPHPTYSQAEHTAVYTTLNERTEALLRQGKDVIYDANLNRHTHRAEKYALARQANARAVLIWVQTSKEIARERAVMRGHHHLVPADETFESMFERITSAIEEPGSNEAVFKLDGTHVNAESIERLLAVIRKT